MEDGQLWQPLFQMQKHVRISNSYICLHLRNSHGLNNPNNLPFLIPFLILFYCIHCFWENGHHASDYNVVLLYCYLHLDVFCLTIQIVIWSWIVYELCCRHTYVVERYCTYVRSYWNFPLKSAVCDQLFCGASVLLPKYVEEACSAGLHHLRLSCRSWQPMVFEIPKVSATHFCFHQWWATGEGYSEQRKPKLWLVTSAGETWVLLRMLWIFLITHCKHASKVILCKFNTCNSVLYAADKPDLCDQSILQSVIAYLYLQCNNELYNITIASYVIIQMLSHWVHLRQVSHWCTYPVYWVILLLYSVFRGIGEWLGGMEFSFHRLSPNINNWTFALLSNLLWHTPYCWLKSLIINVLRNIFT